MSKPTILIVEDEHALASALGASVTRLGAKPTYAASGAQALKSISNDVPTVIVLDIGLPDMNGLDVLTRAFPEGLSLPVLVVTAHGNLENAIAAKRLGVAEYLTKPLDLHAFEEVLGGLLSSPAAVEGDGRGGGETGATMIGASALMQRVFREVAHACTVESPVVIGGASGTGKTLAAHVIHANSDSEGKLLVLECGDAEADRVGEVLQSDVGGVLLENIDRMPSSGQGALLAAIETGETPRLISTARAPLHDAVSEGGFREDLYYRLRGIEIRLPVLAERIEDIPALAAYFLGLASGDRTIAISEDALVTLSERSWPGNVRELANAIDYGVSVCGGGRLLPQHLPADSVRGAGGPGELEGALGRWLDAQFTGGAPRYVELLDELEGLVLAKLLRRFGGKPTHLANELGLNRTTLRKRLERLGLS